MENEDGEDLYPLDVALTEGDPDVAKYLASKGAKNNPTISGEESHLIIEVKDD